jgi:hypothetical protein
LKKQSCTAPWLRQVQRQAFLAEGRLDLLQQQGQVEPRCVDLVDDDGAIAAAFARGVHHALRHHFDAALGVDDDDGRFHCLQRRQRLTGEVGASGGVDQVHAQALGGLEVQQAGLQRVQHAPLQYIVVADRVALLDAARLGDRPGAVQQGFGQRGLAGAGRPDEGQGADAGEIGHGRGSSDALRRRVAAPLHPAD